MTKYEEEAFDRLHKTAPVPVIEPSTNNARDTERAYLGVIDATYGRVPKLSDELWECDLNQDDKNFYDDAI